MISETGTMGGLFMPEKRYVGILLEPHTFQRIPIGKTGIEHLPFYEEGGRIYNLIPCYFRLQDIQSGKSNLVAYVKGLKGYEKQKLPMPQVIHNRTLKGSRRGLYHLVRKGTKIFNLHTRYGKWRIHRILATNDKLIPFLPKTAIASEHSLKQMMKQFDQLIIKPSNGSIGKGIMKLERTGGKWILRYPIAKGKHGQSWQNVSFRNEIPKVLIERIRKNTYLIQERIPLSTFKGNPFDFRVSVQRNANGMWQISGIVAKVAARGHFLTNVARGGKTYPLEILLANHPVHNAQSVKSKLSSLALSIADYLGKKLPHLADLGLDLGITDKGKPYFIECNARDLRYSFRNANMMKEWKETHITPIGYARFLLDKKERRK
jgi:glutathione synthase/RimK-type ligase-like ATP-grasp enzyme